jgi:hypothetical protein
MFQAKIATHCGWLRKVISSCQPCFTDVCVLWRFTCFML